MTHKDQTKKWSNGSGGSGRLRGRGRFSGKKPAPVPKVPKRGPGIAFLEKERIENEERKLIADASSPTPPPPPPPPRISYLPLQLPGFHNSNNISTPSPVPLQSSSYGVSMNFPYESNPPSGWTPRTQQYQQPSSSMVNVPSKNLAAPADDYSKEPPSNQNKSSSFIVPTMVVPMDKVSSESTSTFPAAFPNQELPPRSQRTDEDQIPHGRQPRLQNSFPTKEEEEEAQSVQTTETNKDGNCNGENGESLDLDLHL